MVWNVYIVVALFGLAAGSFLNVVAFRLGSGESILWGRSHCRTCRHVLRWHELIPLASFIALGGKCRACHQPISFQYPVVEALTGIIFLLVYFTYTHTIFPASIFFSAGAPGIFSFILGLLFYFVLGALLLAIALYDARTSLIAPVLLWPFLGFSLLGQVMGFFSGVPASDIGVTLLVALAVFLFFAALWLFSGGRAMGFGDAELAAAIVLFLGAAEGALGLLLSFWIGALFGATLILLRRAHLKSEIPFGPFLAAGAFTALFWGEAILKAYFGFFM